MVEKEIKELENKVKIWKDMSRFKDFSKEIAEAEAKIKELKQQNIYKNKMEFAK